MEHGRFVEEENLDQNEEQDDVSLNFFQKSNNFNVLYPHPVISRPRRIVNSIGVSAITSVSGAVIGASEGNGTVGLALGLATGVGLVVFDSMEAHSRQKVQEKQE